MAQEQDLLPNYEEQRKFPRTGVIWSGTLQTDTETLKCTVLNLSANGAKLKLHAPMTTGRLMGTVAIPRLGSFKATGAGLDVMTDIQIHRVIETVKRQGRRYG